MTQPLDLDALEPCPFCGCEVRLTERQARDEFTGWRTWYDITGEHEGIGSVCPGQVRSRGSAKTAIAAWNTRAPSRLTAQIAPTDLDALEVVLRDLLKGEYSSLSLSFNEESGPNYSTVAEDEHHGGCHGDWVSEQERQQAILTNSKWVLQWYPHTPNGFHALAASSLRALLLSGKFATEPGQ